MSYTNPLHNPIPSHQISSFSTLGSAIQCPSTEDSRLHVPILTWTPTSKWKSAMGPKSSGRTISFTMAGAPANYGAAVDDLTAYSNNTLAGMIHNGNDTVFADTRERKITLRIVWPGYEAIEWAEPIELISMGSPITRSQLAAKVAWNYSAFIRKAASMPSSQADWHISAHLVNKLVVIAIHHIFEDTWQADVVIDTRR